MQIRKIDRQATVAGTEESNKTESSTNNKSRSSKGIAENESKFETAKSSSLFQEYYPRNQNINSNNGTAGGTPSNNNANATPTIVDGTSNTISFGEQPNSSQGPVQRGRPNSGNTVVVEDQQSGNQSTPPIVDGTSNTVSLPEQSDSSTTSNPDPGRGSNPDAPTIVDGTSNTISFPEQSDSSTAPDQDPVSGSPNSDTIGTPVLGEGQESENQAPPAIVDGSSNTIQPEEQDSDVQAGPPRTSREDTSKGTDASSTTTITDGSSNTITVEEQKEEETQKQSEPHNRA